MKIIKKISLLLIVYTSCFILNTEVAQAQSASLRVSPVLLKIRIPTASVVTERITIENTGELPERLKVQLRDFKAGNQEFGEVEFLKENSNNSNNFKNIELLMGEEAVKELILAPGQKKDLTLRISIPENEPHADHYFSILFLGNSDSQVTTAADSQNVTSILAYGIGMNVIMSVGPEVKPQGVIDKFSAPSVVSKGPIPFIVKVHNNTSQYIKPKGTVFIKNMFGQLIGKVNIPETTILANSSRYLENQSQRSNPDNLQPEVIWDESFLLGFYTAELNIELSPDKQALTRTTRFTAFPAKLILIIVGSIILFIIIRKRVKAKMSA